MSKIRKVLNIYFACCLSLVVTKSAYAEGLQYDSVATSMDALSSYFIRSGKTDGLDAIQDIRVGLSFDHVGAMLGEPFSTTQNSTGDQSEFHFNIPLGVSGTNGIVCQYSVAFDKDAAVSDFGWRRPVCKVYYQRYIDRTKTHVVDVFSVSTDVLFEFDSSVLTPEGERAIAEAVAKMNERYQRPSVKLVGYTDRVGSNEYNLQLSEARAGTVFMFMTEQGLLYREIAYEGKGEADPIVECEGTDSDPAVVACLQPNRRVEVSITNSSKEVPVSGVK